MDYIYLLFMVSVYEDIDFVKLYVWFIDKDYLLINIFWVNVLLKVYCFIFNCILLFLNFFELVNYYEIYFSND